MVGGTEASGAIMDKVRLNTPVAMAEWLQTVSPGHAEAVAQAAHAQVRQTADAKMTAFWRDVVGVMGAERTFVSA
jgi:hypothetical protein